MSTKTLLYDQLLTNPNIDSRIKDRLRQAIVVDATNVSDYYFQGTDQDYWDLAKDFPNVAPPFETFYLEFRAPHEIVSSEKGIIPWPKDQPQRWGTLCLSAEMKDLVPDLDTLDGREAYKAENDLKIASLQKVLGSHNVQIANKLWATCDSVQSKDFISQLPEMLQPNMQLYFITLTMRLLLNSECWEEAKRLLLKGSSPTLRWKFEGLLFAQFSGSRFQQHLGPMFAWSMHIGPDGKIAQRANGDVEILYAPCGNLKKSIECTLAENHEQGMSLFEEIRNGLNNQLRTMLLAISFMHCKNVTLSQQIPPKIQPTPKQKRWKMIPPQRVSYHILDIEPMKQVLKTEGQSEHVGIQRSLHICRGHFAHYTEDKKLFGKFAGTFWKPQHVRGSQQIGIADKDYRIKKPKGEPQNSI